jgi:CBS domain-containing protein
MRVKDVMVRSAASCTPQTNLAEATEIFWNRNCGMLPVVNSEGNVIGVVTDRDVCIALGTRNRMAAEIPVEEVISGKLFLCKPDDDIRSALVTMARAQVRRLPVINVEGRLEGILSMDDVILHADPRTAGRTPDLTCDEVVETLKNVYWPHLPELAHKKAARA